MIELANGCYNEEADGDNKVLDELYEKQKKIKRDIKIIKDFSNQTDEYINLKSKTIDSLKPIQYLADNYGELINHPSVVDIISGLQINYKSIIKNVSTIKNSDYGIEEELKNLYNDLEQVSKDIRKLSSSETGANILEKYLFLGEAKAKIELYNKESSGSDLSGAIEELKNELNILESSIEDNEDRKTAVIKLIEMSAQALMGRCKAAMETYANYIPVLNYKEKRLELMNPKIAQISKVVGSSSNYLFLHLFFILSLHEIIIAQNIKYIPSYIILDQPSRPYYDNKNEEFKDKEKITIAIKLLNDYITLINEEYSADFQFIVFEHIPKEIWEGMENVNLVEEFTNGNKLIRKCDISV